MYLDCILHGLFVHHFAWKSSVCIPPSQRREQGLRRPSTITFWVLRAQSGTTGVPGHPWLQSRTGAESHVHQDLDARAFGRSTHCKGKKLFPDCTNLTKQWELQPSQLPTCPISCTSCGLPALLWRRKQWLGSKETWILSPSL